MVDIPTASEGEIRAGIEPSKAITPDRLFPVLADKADKATTLAGYGIVDAATKEQGEKASTAVQPEQVSAVGFSGRYNDLLNKPDLGGSSGLNVGTTAGTVAAGDDSRIVNAVQKATTVSAGAGLAGGGTLAANVALALSSTSLASLALAETAVQPSRKFTVGTGLTGGGDFSADRSVALNTASVGSLALADSAVQPARVIAAGAGLSGGGDLSANRSISLNPATIASLVLADNAVPIVRTVTAGTGLTGGGALNANITLGLDASSVASLARADSAVQPAGIAGFSTKTELTTGLGAKLDSGAQAVDSAKLQGYTPATLPISTATQTVLNGKATTADGALARTAIQPSDLGALARKDTIATTDITATGSTAGGALLTRGGAWVDPTGGGDMFRAVYDPQNIAKDVFDRANHTGPIGIDVVSGLAGVLHGKATAAQGAKADTAVQPAAIANFATKAELTTGLGAKFDKPTGTTAQYLDGQGAPKTFPAIPEQVQSDWNATTGAAAIKNKPALAAVATSGAYGDLSGKPTIPAAQVQADWNAASGMASIANKPATFPPSAHTHTKADVGLSLVDNTSDANKPVSTQQQTALDLKLDKNAQAADSARLGNETAAAWQAEVDAKAGFYTGTNANEVNFPIGHTIGLFTDTTTVARNAIVAPRLHPTNSNEYIVTGTSSLLTGVWVAHGVTGSLGSATFRKAQRIS